MPAVATRATGTSGARHTGAEKSLLSANAELVAKMELVVAIAACRAQKLSWFKLGCQRTPLLSKDAALGRALERML
jgi:hypothetical protein